MSAMFLSEANKLKNIQSYLEKNDILLNHISKYEYEGHLVDYIADLESKRKNQLEQTNQELRSIWRLIKSKKKVLLQENLNNLDLLNFKQEMIELQHKIHVLRVKLSSSNETLEDEEKVLWDVNQILNQKIEEWEKPLKIPTNHNYTASKIVSTNTGNHKEVTVFMDFVNKSNGHENGWASEDHQLFLKLRHKYKNVQDLAVNLNKLLPDITVDDVKHHETWFRQYLLLKNQKEEALERWRQQRKEISTFNTEKVSDQDTQTVKCRTYSHRSKYENIYEQIAQWKAEKEAKRQQENAYAQQKTAKMKRLEEDKKRLNGQVKQIVTKWRESKIMKEEHEKLQKEVREYYQKRIRAATANRMIKQFQSHDDFFIAKMRSNKLKENNKRKPRSKSSYHVERNPDRILKPTKQWLLRTTKDEPEIQLHPYVPNIREIPKLKVPDWRKNN